MLPDGVKHISLILSSNFRQIERLNSLLCILLGLLLHNAGDGGEGELPYAGKGEENRYESDCAFTLHNFCWYF
jgi:hypothetical protein